MSTRLAAGRSCPFLRLVTGEASPAPPGRGLCPLPSPLRGALPPRPPNGGKCPPYPPLKGRVRGRTGQAGPWPGRTGRLLACRKGGSSVPAAGREHANMHGKPTLSARLAAGRSCPFSGLVAGEASPAPPGRGLRPLPTPLRGALPPRPLLRAETPPRVKTKTRQQRGQKNHRPAPRFAALKRRARNKVLCQAFFQESGQESGGKRSSRAPRMPASWPHWAKRKSTGSWVWR